MLPIIFTSLFRGVWKYVLAAAAILGIIFFIWYKGHSAGVTQSETKFQEQQIEIQHDTIKTIQKSKVISKVNAVRERDDLIDEL